jgi:hypothetical protein
MKLAQITPQTLNENDGPTDAGYETTQEIRASLVPHLENEIEKLNRKAQKLNTPVISISVSEPFMKEVTIPDSKRKVKEKFVTVTVDGETPRIDGYDFLATIEHKGAGNIVRTMPGVSETSVKNFYNATPDYCDHCKKKRARIDTFIIKDQKSGELRQIGRNCLQDFLGGKDPKQILFWFSLKGRIDGIFAHADDYQGKLRGRSDYSATADSVLNAAAALINKYGYVKSGNPEATAGLIRTVIFGGMDADYERALRAVVKDGKDKGVEYKEKVLKWWKSVPDAEKDDNNFYHSIDVLLKDDNVSPRDVGYLGAIFPAYERAIGQKKERATMSNAYVGNPGDKLPQTEIKVISTKWIDGQWGSKQNVRMLDKEGNLYVWWNSSRMEMEKGVSYVIVGKIKKHDDYRDQKQTVLTHVKAKEI